jgi:hypothetical protein
MSWGGHFDDITTLSETLADGLVPQNNPKTVSGKQPLIENQEISALFGIPVSGRGLE